MFERRPIIGVLVGLTICVSIWRVSVLEPSMLANEMNNYNSYNQMQQQHTHHHSNNNTRLYLSTITNDQRRNNGQPQIPSTLYGSTVNNSINYQRTTITNLTNFNYSQSRTRPSIINNNNKYDIDVFPKNDATRLIDLDNFEYIINQAPCSKPAKNKRKQPAASLMLLILIHSAPNNYKKRSLIRETWASWRTPKMRVIFLLAGVSTPKQQIDINLENQKYTDIVQGNFNDNYRNMTYKHVMALKWFSYYCSNAQYLLKVDDDVFINTPYLMQFLMEQNTGLRGSVDLGCHNPKHTKGENRTITASTNNKDNINQIWRKENFIFCVEQWKGIVSRSYRNKWRVSKKEYAGKYYPPYCPGYAILYSGDVVLKLYELAQKTPYFWIDDVHVTGTLRKLANLTITTSFSYIITQEKYKTLDLQSTEFNCAFWWTAMLKGQSTSLWKNLQKKYALTV